MNSETNDPMSSPPPPSGGPVTDPDARQWATFAHLSFLASIFIPLIGGIAAAFIIWQIKKDQSSFVDRHAKEALNFQITAFLAYVVSLILVKIWIGWLLMTAAGLAALVLAIMAALEANKGNEYTYPFSLRLVK